MNLAKFERGRCDGSLPDRLQAVFWEAVINPIRTAMSTNREAVRAMPYVNQEYFDLVWRDDPAKFLQDIDEVTAVLGGGRRSGSAFDDEKVRDTLIQAWMLINRNSEQGQDSNKVFLKSFEMLEFEIPETLKPISRSIRRPQGSARDRS